MAHENVLAVGQTAQARRPMLTRPLPATGCTVEAALCSGPRGACAAAGPPHRRPYAARPFVFNHTSILHHSCCTTSSEADDLEDVLAQARRPRRPGAWEDQTEQSDAPKGHSQRPGLRAGRPGESGLGQRAQRAHCNPCIPLSSRRPPAAAAAAPRSARSARRCGPPFVWRRRQRRPAAAAAPSPRSWCGRSTTSPSRTCLLSAARRPRCARRSRRHRVVAVCGWAQPGLRGRHTWGQSP
jgi:hypothetical protein